MGRLTYMHDGRWCINGANGKLTGDNQANYWGGAIDQLAAYENSRMEPCDYKAMAAAIEQCEEAKRQLNELIGAVGGAGFEHIKELARQEKAGRLEVLPCRPGDTVYTVDKIGGAYKVNEWQAVEISIDKSCGIVVLEHPHHGIRTRRGCDFEAFGVSAFLHMGTAIRAMRNRKTGITHVAEEEK